MTLMLEIVEGPGAGTQFDVSRPLVIGRDDTADLVIEDSQASRRHARIEPTANGAIVEDLQSTNGTFVNDNELHGRVEMGPDDELIIGVTVMQVRTPQAVQRQPSAVRAVPGLRHPGVAPRLHRAGQGRRRERPPADRLRRPGARAPARLARQDEGEPRPARDLRARGARRRDLPRRHLAARGSAATRSTTSPAAVPRDGRVGEHLRHPQPRRGLAPPPARARLVAAEGLGGLVGRRRDGSGAAAAGAGAGAASRRRGAGRSPATVASRRGRGGAWLTTVPCAGEWARVTPAPSGSSGGASTAKHGHAHGQHRPVADAGGTVDAGAVDARAVARAEVFDLEPAVLGAHGDVAAGELGVIDLDVDVLTPMAAARHLDTASFVLG